MASGKMNAHVDSTTVATAGRAKGACSKDSAPPEEVLLDTLPAKEVEALFEYARTGVKAFKAMDDDVQLFL